MKNVDSMFDENLQLFGAGRATPEGLSDDVRQRCLTALNQSPGSRAGSILRRPAFLSTVGLAVLLATVCGFLFPTNGGPVVRAATVLEKLSKQVAGTKALEVQLDKVEVEDIAVDGHVFVAETAIAGDIQVRIDEGDGLLEVDASFGITEGEGWVLVRKLRIPEAEAQVFVDMFLPRGVDTLIKLPPGLVHAKLAGVGGGLNHVREMAGGHVTAVVKTILESKSSAAAKTERLADGTILLTVELADEAAVKELLGMVAKSIGQEADADIELEHDDVGELLGGAFGVVYDPKTETVRSFSVSGVHGIKGVITVSLQGGTIAPELLDPARVSRPDTRVLDLAPLLSSLEGLKGVLHHDHD